VVQNQAHELFVAIDGDDTGPGTLARPLATLAVAHKKARDSIASMQGDVIIHLRAGIHYLASPLLLAAESDAGLNGHHVSYQAYGYGTNAQEDATVSGGKEITTWKLHDADKNIWVANIGDIRTRQLFVNGKRAPRATLTDISGPLTRTTAGYDIDNTQPQTWGNTGDLEFVYTGIYPWSEARIGIEAIKASHDSTSILMKQPAFTWASNLYKSKAPEGERKNAVSNLGMSRPTSIENGLGFLSEPGTFVFDSSMPGQHKLYYIPRKDEDMQTVQAIIPILEALIQGRGTESAPLRNVTFRGLTFAHATWQVPSGPNCFVHYHGATYYVGGGLQKIKLDEDAWVTVPSESEYMPSAITFEHSRAITFENNRFTHIGTGGLEFAVGCSFNTITGNVFEDISATALTVGSPSADKVANQETKHNRIENNWFHHIGNEYHGSSAVLVVEAQHTIIAHNQINDVPHAGIVGYGDGATRGVRITNNLVFNSMNLLADGGGINLASAQGTSYDDGALVSGNVIRDTLTSYNFGFYPDYATAWTVVENNIIYRADTPTVLRVIPPIHHVTFRGNFWDKQPYGYDKLPATVIVTDNTILPSDPIEAAIASNPAAKQIAEQAGIEHSHPLYKAVQ